MAVTMVNYVTGRHVFLVKACAWCPRSKRPTLKVGEAYTDGLCPIHLRELMGQLKETGRKKIWQS